LNTILVGCEYSGTTTLAYAITDWAKSALGGPFGFHDHWKIPHLGHPKSDSDDHYQQMIADWRAGTGEDPTVTGFDKKEQELFLALTPGQKECFQRYHMEYHLSDAFYGYRHHNVVGMHIDEAVYAGLYYGYGGDGDYADRKVYARKLEKTILKRAPNSVLILVKASPEVIRKRMSDNPHHNGLIKDKDVELVLGRFEEEYDLSILSNKFTIDTSTATVEESLGEFVHKMDQFLTDSDRTDMLVNNAKARGEWV